MDHLGSIIAMTDIDGNLKEALGYDTWGNRRNAVGAPVSIATTLTAEVNETTDDKGYTGAEQITSLELVHLNGRVYDPLIARFLSGDPHVTDPKNGQNYNRYSYVLNNPMNGTDPTGFDEAPDNPSDNEVTPGAGSGYLMASVATNSTTGVVTFTFSDGSTITSSPTGQITGGTYTDSTGNLVTVTSTTTTPIGSNVPVTSYSPALAAAVAALYPAAPADISTTSLPSYYPVAQVGGTALVSMGSTSGGTPSAAGQLGDYAYGTQGNPFAPNGAGLVNDIGAQNGTTYIGATIGVSASLLGGETLGALSSALALENLATPTAAWTLMGALTRVDGSVWSEFIEVSLPQSLNASAPASQASMLANQINASNRFAWFINANPTLTWCPK
jgi:RHS repeat-associated protein